MKIENCIVYEDNHLFVVNKPSGILVQGDKTGDMTLLDYSKLHIKKTKNKLGEVYLGLPHRIDRPVSGLVIMCKTSKSLTRMTKLFRERLILKSYMAIVHGIPRSMKYTLVDYIVNNTRGKKTFVTNDKNTEAKRAELDFEFLMTNDNLSLLKVLPKTGRKHQIRVQLTNAGYPIAGDLKYGSHLRLGKYICLHAHQLEFIHPIKNEAMIIKSTLPTDELWTKFDLGDNDH